MLTVAVILFSGDAISGAGCIACSGVFCATGLLFGLSMYIAPPVNIIAAIPAEKENAFMYLWMCILIGKMMRPFDIIQVYHDDN